MLAAEMTLAEDKANEGTTVTAASSSSPEQESAGEAVEPDASLNTPESCDAAGPENLQRASQKHWGQMEV